MSGIANLFEPEEVIGSLWHRLVGEVDKEPCYPEAAISLEQMQRRLQIFFRGLGGTAGVEIKAIKPQEASYRQRILARIGHGSTAVTKARFDGDHLLLPETIEMLPEKAHNEILYKWLTAWAAIAGEDTPKACSDPLQNDIAHMRYSVAVSQNLLDQYTGLKKLHDQVAPHLLNNRLIRKLPEQEEAIEQCIRAVLGAGEPEGVAAPIWQAIMNPETNLQEFVADPGYKSFMPLILWGEILPRKLAKPGMREDPVEGAPAAKEAEQEHTRKAKRNESDEIEKDDPLVLHRFESVLSWSEMMNISRDVDDDDEESAKKAAEDQDEIGLANLSRKAATKLKFDLDLAPEDVMHDRLSAKHTYPEWDYRKNIYHADHCRVLARTAPEMEEGRLWQPDREARKRIRAVKRQFEALRPRRERLLRQIDGDDLDMDAIIRARCDFAASGESSNRVFTSVRNNGRDLAVGVLIDTSRSSESWIEGRQVIDISREALIALSLGLAACGDDNAIYAFSSLRRDRVTVSTVKEFDEALGPQVFSRIGALKPGFYTRLGAAMRHVSKELANTANEKRLLLVLTDGKPNDLDHYEGRYGVEDTARAVREARRAGIAVFGITIDKKAQSYFPYIFGQNAYAIAGHANDLTKALPLMYRHLVS